MGGVFAALPDPPSALRACVVVPARNEQERIGACVLALAQQDGVAADAYEVLLVLDNCTDATERVALRTAAAAARSGRWLTLHTLEGPARGVGPARRAGMDLAAARLRGTPAGPQGLIVSTDADSITAPDWLASFLTAGRPAAGGAIELDPEEAAELPPEVLSREAEYVARRLASVRRHTPGADHHQFWGANLALSVASYEAIGGLPDVPALEDEALERALRDAGIPIAYLAAPRVRTSARLEGRATHGLGAVLRAAVWTARQAPALALVPDVPPDPDAGVLVVAPTGPDRGAALHDALRDPPPRASLPAPSELPEPRAPGAASRPAPSDPQQPRALARPAAGLPRDPAAVAPGAADAPVFADVVLVLGPGRTAAQAAPLVDRLRADPSVQLVRSTEAAGALDELVARPLLNLLAPELAVVAAPLTQTWAIRRTALEPLWLPESGAVDLTVLVDVWRTAGLPAIAELALPPTATEPPAPDGLAAYQLQIALTRRLGPRGGVALSSAYTDTSGTRSAGFHERPPLHR